MTLTKALLQVQSQSLAGQQNLGKGIAVLLGAAISEDNVMVGFINRDPQAFVGCNRVMVCEGKTLNSRTEGQFGTHFRGAMSPIPLFIDHLLEAKLRVEYE